MSGLVLPKRTSDRVCCHVCHERTPFLGTGLADWHTNPAGALCAGVFPPYVVARDPQTKKRRPVPAHGIPWRAPRAAARRP